MANPTISADPVVVHAITHAIVDLNPIQGMVLYMFPSMEFRTGAMPGEASYLH